MLHVLRPQRIASGVERGGGNHRVINRKAVALSEPQSRLVCFNRERMDREQAAQQA